MRNIYKHVLDLTRKLSFLRFTKKKVPACMCTHNARRIHVQIGKYYWNRQKIVVHVLQIVKEAIKQLCHTTIYVKVFPHVASLYPLVMHGTIYQLMSTPSLNTHMKEHVSTTLTLSSH